MSENKINTESSEPSPEHEEELRKPPSRKTVKPVDQGKLKREAQKRAKKRPLLTKIVEKFKKDKHSTVGLTKSVNRRKKLLAYLKKKNPDSYSKVIKQLNLRK